MKQFILLIVIPFQLAAQDKLFDIKFQAGWSNTFDETYYVTTLDWNGLSMVANGTARNITLLGNQIGGVAGQIADIFSGSNKPPMIVTDGDFTYYNYQDKVITEEKRYARSMSAIIGLEAGLYSKPVTLVAGVRNSKYKYVMPDVYTSIRVNPWWVYAKAKEVVTGFQYEYETYQTWLGLFSIGYTTGIDAGYPGFFTKFAEKKYSGLTLGLGSVVRTRFNKNSSQTHKDVSWLIEGFKQFNPPHEGLSQSGVRVSIGINI
jgi:hypothetical protein